MKPPFRILIMGATGLVGREILRILETRDWANEEVVVAASPNSVGRPLHIGTERLTLQDVTKVECRPRDLVFFTGHDDLAADLVPKVVATGAIVIDNSATFRMDPTVPLVVPEINADAMTDQHGLIANPNCTTITFLLPLAALHRKWGVGWASVASYQSISGAGTAPYETFRQQMTDAALEGKSSDASRLPYNVIPAIGSFNETGATSEETKMRLESRKILGDDTVTVFGTAVRVPTMVGHLTAVHVQLASAPGSIDEVREIIAAFPGIVLQDDPAAGIWPTPLGVAGTDPVAVGRIRMLDERTVGFVSAADNLRKGAALNAVQIADALLARG